MNKKRCPRCGGADYVSFWSVKKHQLSEQQGYGKRTELILLQAIYPNAMLCVDCDATDNGRMPDPHRG